MFTNSQIIQIIGISRTTYFRRINELKLNGIIKFETSKLIPENKAIEITQNLGLVSRFIDYLNTQKNKK